ncbi:MAG: molybdopterin molybdotransferase MoeA [Bacteroidetes bacterium]|nr:molybdopterin molybdotransferase MoeA [Bacteroidota bacterium]
MAVNFIPVTEAKKLIRENTNILSPVWLPLQKAAGLVSATDVFATTDIPSYPQSSMDGYAISFEGWQKNKILQIEGESAAGTHESISLVPEKAVRIFTGAPLPTGADTVVMQEKTKTENGILIIDDKNLVAGLNVRPKGSEIKTGELAFSKHKIVTPPAIGFLAGIGNTEVNVYPSPRVSLIITGNELQEPGNPLEYGQVYESNSFALKAALQQSGIHTIYAFKAEDTLEILTDKLNSALHQSDAVLLTGGASVGDYDFVLQAAANCGVETIFHKIKQRPGKPLFFGKQENKLVFGLPGNPASVLTCFYEYVAPALLQMSNKSFSLQKMNIPIAKPFKKPAGLTHFLKGYYDGKSVTALNAQESYRLSSFANANCLIQVNEESTHINAGELVEIHLLPQ